MTTTATSADAGDFDDVPLVLDPHVTRLDGGRVLLGGDPGRLVRLRSTASSWATSRPTAPARALGRALLDGGLAHPRPHPVPVLDVSVVVPVRDRADELDRCLRALGRQLPVLVVDDGSRDPAAVAGVCRRHGARVLALPANGGPAAARNAGLAATSSALVAFVDSDCTPGPGWLAALLGHFADPSVGAVAPRVRGGVPPRVRGAVAPRVRSAGGTTLLARYAAARGPLDLGPQEARVRPGGRVPYVPTAALVVRRAALAGGPPFDPALRYGEDVDLVWRLHDAGWTVRYDPAVVVPHAEPDRWGAWLERRYRYGTSAAPLSARHGARLAPLVVPPWPTAAWLLLLAGRPLPALAAAVVPVVRLHRRLRRTGLPTATCARAAATATARGVLATGSGLGGAGTVVTLPLLLALLGPRPTRRAAAAALLAPPLLELLARRPAVDPVRWTALRLLDDVAYGAGVWRGCLRARSASALRPRLTRPS